jgi:DNA-binding transcriptional LysR family regulator
MNFRQLDLNLLRVLVAIHRSRSVTAASQALSLSQPATSNALARLRGFFDDALFVRSPSGLQPTRLCETLAPAIQAQLHTLENLVAGQQAFDPVSGPVHWRLSLSDLGEILFIPRIAAALREQAPLASLSNVAVAANDVSGALESRDIDMAIGILQAQHRAIRRERLFKEEFMAVASPHWKPHGRVRASPLSREPLSQAQFVVVSPLATFHGSVETMLVRMRLQDRIVLRVRHFGAIADLVRDAHLVAIVPEMYARDLAARHDLRMYRIQDAPSYEVHLLWHNSTDRDEAHRWMRGLIKSLFLRPDQAVEPTPAMRLR